MGAASSRTTTPAERQCVIRNQLGRDVRLACKAGDDHSAQQVVRRNLTHGYEHEIRIDGSSRPSTELIIALELSAENVAAYRIRCGSKLMLRKGDKGEAVVRELQPGADTWRCPEPGDASQLTFQEERAVPEQAEETPAAVAADASGSEESEQQRKRSRESQALGLEETATPELAGVSEDPVTCEVVFDISSDDSADEAVALEQVALPEPTSQEHLLAELLDLGIHHVRAQRVVEAHEVTDLESAIQWLERHQDDEDIDIPAEEVRLKAFQELASAVLRVATVPAASRVPCYQTLHSILGHILEDPTSLRRRQIRLNNQKFKERVGRFPQAMKLLRMIGFTQGDYWVSAYSREPCLEFRLPVDSDNPASQRFVQAYSLIYEILREPEKWLPMVPEPSAAPAAVPPVAVAAPQAAAQLAAAVRDGAMAGAATRPREFLADLHERRVRDPRAFQEAMRAAGRRGNRMVIDVRTPAPGPDSTGGPKTLQERLGGRRQVTMDDIERIRVEDAIANTPLYAEEYMRNADTARSYGQLVARSYDPQYLGRKAVDGTNVFRGEQKKPPLKWSQALADIAEEHAKQMARGEAPFSHDGFDDRVRRYPFLYSSAAENLAYNGGVSDTAGTAVQGWIKSPGHRKNLLGEFDLCGVGVAQSASGQFYFTQLFARTR